MVRQRGNTCEWTLFSIIRMVLLMKDLCICFKWYMGYNIYSVVKFDVLIKLWPYILGFDIFEYLEYVYMDYENFYIYLAMCGVLGLLR